MSAPQSLQVQGLPLRYLRSAPRAEATPTPVLALHGWGASVALMEPVVERLGRLGHDVLAFDLPGFGATPPPPVPWGVNDYAQFVLAALDALGIAQTHLLGHSFGGRISLVLAGESPARVGKLVLADSAGVPPKRDPLAEARLNTFKTVRGGLEAVGAAGLSSRLRAWYGGRYGSADYQQTSGVMRETFVRVVNQDLRPYAARIQCPALLFWGDQDVDTPLWQGRALEQLIPDAGLVVLAGAGHYSYLDKIDEFIRVTDYFLRQAATTS
jgi:pimeloyl-ACP methyl ester carboxylesterase